MIKRKVQVAVIYRNQSKQNKLLLLKLIPERGGHWQNVTGHVEKNETLIEAAQRELTEETSIAPNHFQIIDPKFSFEFTDRFQEQRYESGYIAWVDTDQIIIDPIEHTEFKWVDIDSLTQEDYGFKSHWDLIQHVREEL